ncbi:MAG: hypothetical protein U0992_14705 [Planctomycetaceae bacterium]
MLLRRAGGGMLVLFAVLVAATSVSAVDFPSSTAVDIGTRKQLLVDDFVIAETKGVTRVVGDVEKANGGQPLVFTRRDADGRPVRIDVWPAFATVYYDAERGKFRMWYRISFNDRSRRDAVGNVSAFDLGVGSDYRRAYAESDDGIHFEYVADLEGLTTSGDTNMVVTIDDHESDPAHRYKIGYDAATEVHAAALAHSADGIHWTPYNHGQPVTYRANDFTNQVTWDESIRAYRLLTRTDFGAGGGPLADRVNVPIGDHRLEVRGVRSMINPDIKADPTNWTLERHWLFDGEEVHRADRPPIEALLADPAYVARVQQEALRRQLYMMTDWQHEGVHFGLMAVLEYPTDVSEGTETDPVTRHERSIENYYFATGRDGVGWDLHWVYAGRPLVSRGPTGAWDKDMIFPVTNIVTHQDQHWIYYGGNNERHGCAEKDIWFGRQGSIGLAKLRLDGFLGWEAGESSGTLTTRPFVLVGPHLELNVSSANGGSVRVEMLDAEGRAIPKYAGANAVSAAGIDDVRYRPNWKDQADLASLVGRTVRLHVTLKNARLYAIQVRE